MGKYIIRMGAKWKEILKGKEEIVFHDISEYAVNVEVYDINSFIKANNFMLEDELFIKFGSDTIGAIISTELTTNIKCKSDSCKDNYNSICTHKIEDLSFDTRGQCEKYCSKNNCIVCDQKVGHINAYLADLCNECQELIESGDIQVIYKEYLSEYGLQRAKVGKELVINKNDWKVIKVDENKEYKVIKRIV